MNRHLHLLHLPLHLHHPLRRLHHLHLHPQSIRLDRGASRVTKGPQKRENRLRAGVAPCPLYKCRPAVEALRCPVPLRP